MDSSEFPKQNPVCKALLVRLPAGAGASLSASPKSRKLSAAGVKLELEPLFVSGSAGVGGPGLAGGGSEWHVARSVSGALDANAWDAAHEAISGMSLAGGPAFVEPDFEQPWLHERPGDQRALLGAGGEACRFDDQESNLPGRSGAFAWHLGIDCSQLRAARDMAAGAAAIVRIAHLDTGYDPTHSTYPGDQIDAPLQRNFVDRDRPRDAEDPRNAGLMKHPGHGTGTLSILAGGRFGFSGAGYVFDDVLGGAPRARIVPIRVGNSVVQLSTSSVAAGFDYAASLCDTPATRVHVLSMSMGGIASDAWADAVNKAYEAGIVLVTAAGNNISAGFFGFPARSIVYPARFRRVIAACGVMANRKPYFGLPFGTMQGNWGPESKMATALSAFTPNIPWAQIGCPGIVDLNGAGTSSATPQIAALAALYCQVHATALAAYPHPWMAVEAVRRALFGSADRTADGGASTKLGNGIIRAVNALQTPPAPSATLSMTRPDSSSFPFLRVITGMGIAPGPQARMLELEATQLAQRWARGDTPNPLEDAVRDPDRDPADVPVDERRRFFEVVESHPDASEALQRKAREVLEGLDPGHGSSPVPPRPPPTKPRPRRAKAGRTADAAPVEAAASSAPAVASQPPLFTPPTPPTRCLRGYAIDPTLATTLDTVAISQIALHVPWEKLEPGPVGEYLEVIDIDPASQCCYAPVDLDEPMLLAQDGLPPSEGTPQFHQQMVYAVCSLTIRNFERALGRRTLWRHGPTPDPKNRYDDSRYVQRLRVYPHALREANAYYSPDKVALMFGYFNAGELDDREHLSGGRVFTCLSHDIVAHETTHAILDGMDPELLVPSNPDVPAFHEGFADLVALFQHFTFPEILRHQIAATRGDIRRQRSVLGQLAGQFGLATGLRGALRHGIGRMQGGTWVAHEADPSDYPSATEAHDRGAVLVGAVFDAFLAIYEKRSADLLRLATGGGGILAAGAIPPDLVNRLAAEAAKAAQHVLTMCVRALDFCPPTDITFGEYLRAIITADCAAVPDDDLTYRVAFVEAFRRRGIYPRDVRSLSVESLRWRSPDEESRPPSMRLLDLLEQLRRHAFEQQYARSREDVFNLQRQLRLELHHRLEDLLTSGPRASDDAAFLGLDRDSRFQVHVARFAHRISPDGDIQPQLILSLLQRRSEPMDPSDPHGDSIRFRGGSTIVADLRSRAVLCCIRKNFASKDRLARQQALARDRSGGLASVYRRSDSTEPGAEPFARLHRGH